MKQVPAEPEKHIHLQEVLAAVEHKVEQAVEAIAAVNLEQVAETGEEESNTEVSEATEETKDETPAQSDSRVSESQEADGD